MRAYKFTRIPADLLQVDFSFFTIIKLGIQGWKAFLERKDVFLHSNDKLILTNIICRKALK